ncbi:LysR family transcriptional regulator [Companilactobacillus halodurans]|uniref:LysR family transcriptional regulator n=1 Tax=Companilactobacillus halodurans TaxID=2584183 RepID=A0A5P0ZRU6_9LACO|nr:LysR family transcriptional regulator [Companilactobacillus halodurans]MQS76785.1 LysR family transcriptional regulator [Companilactobacillus halodurans]MQS98512.1 LysR family transcriptional regulator [Companilactobacillus halodurans]
METRLLKYFLTIAQLGTISQAARELHITQPTLSRQLKSLEDELGTRLFTREQHQMILTKAGLEFQNDAKQIIKMIERSQQRVKQVENDIVGTIAVGCIEANAAQLLASVIKEYHQKYPGVKFELYDLDSTDIQERLDQGLLDLGIVLKPSETIKYHSKDLNLTDKWGVVVPKKRFPEQISIKKADLLKLPLFITRNNIMQSEMKTLLGISFSQLNLVGIQNLVSNSLYLTDNETAYPLCASGAFVGETKTLKFLQIDNVKPIYQQMIWSKQRKVPTIVNKFIEMMIKIDSNNNE